MLALTFQSVITFNVPVVHRVHSSAVATAPLPMISSRLVAPRMEARSSWSALDDGTPLGLLEKDADAVFDMLDADSDGAITKSEMTSKLEASGYAQASIEKVFGKIDTNADGEISRKEWAAAYVKFVTLRTAPGLGGALKEKLSADADKVFDAIDTDSNGTISSDEMREHLQGCGYEAAFTDRVLMAIDFDASGEIDRDELRKAFIVHPSMRSAPGLGGGPCDALSGGD